MRIPLTTAFTLIPEGEHVFRIYGVLYNEDFGVLTVHSVTAEGQTHRETFRFKGANDEPNTGALTAFSILARAATNDYAAEDIDPADLVGCYFGAEVHHEKVTSRRPGNEGKELTFLKITRRWSAEGFEKTPVPAALTMAMKPMEPEKAPATPAPEAKDLGSLLANL